MLNKPETNYGGVGLSSPAQDEDAKLTIDQKRKLTLEWFNSNVSIGDFRAGEKGVPRPFIRKAVKTLGLEDLREKRDEEGCAALAETKIMTFRLGVSPDLEKKPRKENPLSLDEKRQITAEWFRSDASSIREFRSGDKTVPRGFMRKAVSALDLLELRKKRDQNGVMEVVEDKIKNYRPGRNGPRERKAAGLKQAKPVASAKGSEVTLEEKRSYVLEWFASDSSIRDFRSGEKDIPRGFIRAAANALDLKQLRKKRGEACVSEDVEAKIKAFHPKKHQASEPAGEKVTLKAINPQMMKALIMEWFDDPKARSVPRFLKDEGAFEAKGQVMSIVKATPLRKLRKGRQELGVRDEADAAVAKALGEADAHSVVACEMKLDNLDLGSGRDKLHQGAQGEAPEEQSYDAKVKMLIQQWFDSDKMKPIDRVLQENNAVELKNVVVELIKKNGLRKLRKERENPDVRKKAAEKINGMCSSTLFQTKKQALGVGTGKKHRDETTNSSKKDLLQCLLLEFFHDDEMLSIPDFLERRDALELRKEMARLVRKLRLDKLKRQRAKIKKVATMRIENAFGRTKTTETEEVETEQESSDGMDADA
uniref:Uncharacterized protein n=1 Tax=Odontella aurita TaxID=265563 RepID=A0A7S4N9L8_9STRA|mmetsp:Transcript_54642/g.163303  ORF Transcript_54642/g.163303 Transcript_54642/m.163303 type:complete len:593 (+) Transcript_54642:79-1857(+)